VKKDYVKQLEASNEELQRKLLEQADIMDSLSAAFAQTRNEMKRNRMVVVCSDEQDAIKSGVGRGRVGDIVFTADIMVIPVTQEERIKVYEKYQISAGVRLNLFKSIKDRTHKQGSIYDTDMLRSYARCEAVRPYEI